MSHLKHLYSKFLEVVHLDNEASLKLNVQQAVESLEFEHFLFAGRNNVIMGGSDIFLFGTYPNEWIEKYQIENYSNIDPCFEHISNHKYPLVWSNKLFCNGKAGGFYEEAKKYSVSAGAVCPLNNFGSGIFGFGVARGTDADVSSDYVSEILPEICLLSSFCSESFFKILISRNEDAYILTKRERQCVELAAVGLRDLDIADKLNLSDRTVLFHLTNARLKMKAENRCHMIAKAILSGLVNP